MSKAITYEDLRAHNNKESPWVLLHDKVYDVTSFIDEHPGGDEVILAEAGQDATEAFEDVGHSDEARALLPNMLIGDLVKTEAAPKKPTSASVASSPAVSNAVEKGSNLFYFAPLALLFAYFAWRYYSGTYAA